MNQILAQQAGVCRHRAQAFIAIAKELGLTCRYVESDLHAYVEVLEPQGWVHADLGGGRANIHILPFTQEPPKKAPAVAPVLEALSPDNPYRTWDTQPSTSTTFPEYAAELLRLGARLPAGARNILCTLEREQIDGLHQALLNQIKQGPNRLFFIDDLNHVPMHDILVDNEQQTYSKTDSTLVRFLKTAKAGDVLMVNWSDYETEHIGLNTLIDKERRLHDLLIDKGVTVISVLSHDKKEELGEDFYSRCRTVSHMPKALSQAPNTIPIQAPQDLHDAAELCFFDEDWRTPLTGAIQLTTQGYHLPDSALVAALKEGKKTLVLRQAPWHLPDFRAFMRALEANGGIEVNGIHHPLQGVIFYRDDKAYDLHDAPLAPVALEEPSPALILNNETYHAFFQRYRVEDQHLKTEPGFIEQYQGKTLPLLLTSPLSNNKWAQLFAQAKKEGVLLHLSLAPGVELPKGIQAHSMARPERPTKAIRLTNDLSCSLVNEGNKVIIPINENTSVADLIETVTRVGEGEELRFQSELKALSQALLEGKDVLLAGNPSKALAQSLASLFLNPPYLMLNGQRIEMNGRVTLVLEKATWYTKN